MGVNGYTVGSGAHLLFLLALQPLLLLLQVEALLGERGLLLVLGGDLRIKAAGGSNTCMCMVHGVKINDNEHSTICVMVP